jgi:hypothetical protein
MLRRRQYRNNVKTAQIAQMHRCIDASIRTLQPDETEPACPICHGRFPEGAGRVEDRPEYASSWRPLAYCSEECYALRPAWRA